MARGYPDQFGHKLNAPYVWIPLAAIFFFALLDFRRKWRMAHLDLLVLLSFGISEIYFNQGNIGVSVPLTYPPLLYLLARMIWVGLPGRRGGAAPVDAHRPGSRSAAPFCSAFASPSTSPTPGSSTSATRA